ncbi:hypothetical protein D3C86_1208260 [compost metagenome]
MVRVLRSLLTRLLTLSTTFSKTSFASFCATILEFTEELELENPVSTLAETGPKLPEADACTEISFAFAWMADETFSRLNFSVDWESVSRNVSSSIK